VPNYAKHRIGKGVTFIEVGMESKNLIPIISGRNEKADYRKRVIGFVKGLAAQFLAYGKW